MAWIEVKGDARPSSSVWVATRDGSTVNRNGLGYWNYGERRWCRPYSHEPIKFEVVAWHLLNDPPAYVPPEKWNDPKESLPGVGVKVRWMRDTCASGNPWVTTGHINEEGRVRHSDFAGESLLCTFQGWLPLKDGGP